MRSRAVQDEFRRRESRDAIRGAGRTLRSWFSAVCFGLLTNCGGPAPQPEVPSRNFAVGVNIEALDYFGTEVPTLNLFKLAAPWFTQCDATTDPLCQPGMFAEPQGNSWDTHEQHRLELDPHGYPRRLPDPGARSARKINFTSVATLLPTGLHRNNPAGRFLVLYDGEGTIEYGRGAVRNSALSRPGRDVLDVLTGGEQTWIQLAIRSTDPLRNGNYLRNIRVLPDGGACSDDRTAYCTNTAPGPACKTGAACVEFEKTEADQPFDPRFLANLKRFKVIRFMGFQNTNNALTETWAQRTVPDMATWVSKQGDGGPIEMMAMLGNQLDADIWVNMPARADDDYVRQFAAMVKQRLEPLRRVYVEYSNEAWNTAFAAGAWIEQQATARWPDASDTPFGKRLQWFGMRTAQICDIWEEIWADAADRVVCVMGSQAANTWTAVQALDCPLWAMENGGIPCRRHHVDALAIAPYFGFYIGSPEHASTIRAWTRLPDRGLGNLFAEIFQGGQFTDSPTGGALTQAREHIGRNLAVAGKRGLELVGYEGGQHLVGVGTTLQDPAVNDLFIAGNRDPRMARAYGVHLDDWRASGGGLYNLWSSVSPYSLWGSWGLLEYRGQESAPKYDAVMQFIAEPDRSGN